MIKPRQGGGGNINIMKLMKQRLGKDRYCCHIDDCSKINFILDKDLLEPQYTELIVEACSKCSDLQIKGMKQFKIPLADLVKTDYRREVWLYPVIIFILIKCAVSSILAPFCRILGLVVKTNFNTSR